MRPKWMNLVAFMLIGASLISWLSCAGTGPNPARMTGARSMLDKQFNLETFNLISSEQGKSLLHVNLDVPYSNIQFEKKEQGYLGRLEASFLVLNQNHTEIVSDVIRQVKVAEFTLTTRRDQFERFSKSFDLDPGNYELIVTLRDKNSLSDATQREKIELKDFRNLKIAVTDVLFFTQESPDSIVAADVIPLHTGKLPEKIYGFVQIRSAAPKDLIKFSYRLTEPRGNIAFRKEYEFSLTDSSEWIHFEFPRASMQIGKNLFELEVANNTHKDKTSKILYYKWMDGARTAAQLEQAIEQLRYLATNDELSQIRKASEPEKRAWFEEFWKKKDPNPATPENELQEEYYTRINEANLSFNETAVPGWQTDRGRIYILFGAPDSISRDPSQQGFAANYEIWRYDRIGKTFVFRETIGGQYWLVSEGS